MLYRKYRLFDDGVEIMIPSEIRPAETFVPSQNSWMSKDRRTVINVTMGGADLTEDGLGLRLNEYYKGFCKDIRLFKCLHIRKRNINRRIYGEVQYLSKVAEYSFYTLFLLGNYRNREFIITIQCMESDRAANAHIFENISDSIRILKKQDGYVEDGRHAG